MYKCSKCMCSFTCKNNLSHHEIIHKKARFQCSKCIVTFKYKSDRTRHEKNKHGIARVKNDAKIEIAPQVVVPDIPAGPSNKQSSDLRDDDDDDDVIYVDTKYNFKMDNEFIKTDTTQQTPTTPEFKEVSSVFTGVATQNKNKKIQCIECGSHYDLNYHNRHIQTIKHSSACVENLRRQFDFENFRIYPHPVCVTKTEFFDSIEQDFTILVKHLLLKLNAVVIDIYFFALYHENSLNVVNKNIAEVQDFHVYNKEFNRNTDVYKMFKDIVNSLIFQSDAKTLQDGWILEEMLYVEIIIVNKLFDNEVSPISLDQIRQINRNNLQNTEPQLYIRCNPCSVYIAQQNYEQHNKTTAHNISLCYFKNERIQINGVQWDNSFLRCRILSPFYFSNIDYYFKSIENDVLDLTDNILRLQNYENVNVSIKMFGLYNHKDLKSKSVKFADVKSFMMENEILSIATIGFWFQKISNTFKSYHQTYLTSMNRSYYLANVMFLDLYFEEITNI